MLDAHALRCARRSRSENHVRQILRRRAGREVLGAFNRKALVIEIQHLCGGLGNLLGQVPLRKHRDGRGFFEH